MYDRAIFSSSRPTYAKVLVTLCRGPVTGGIPNGSYGSRDHLPRITGAQMTVPFDIALDRSRPTLLAEQICATLRTAIVDGRLEPGMRLPSWLDLASRLGVARGTVKAAYEKLADEELVITAGPAGTRVAQKPAVHVEAPRIEIRRPLEGIVRDFCLPPLPFQVGIPALDAFPGKLWARLRTRALREDALAPGVRADPRGTAELRKQIAGYLAFARGIRCLPDQVILTGGYRNGMALAVNTLRLQGQSVWLEEPGDPIIRRGLDLAGVNVVAVPVDDQGLLVERGIERAPRAALAVVTPGQQAPTGVTLSPARRQALLQWAGEAGARIVEDDYLGDLQLSGRAAPALAAEDGNGRVIYIGSFGKTLSAALGLGFLVAPLALAERFGEVAACLQPAPNTTTQAALARFIADGHYLRHLRQMKGLYAQRRDLLCAALRETIGIDVETTAGLAAILPLPPGTDDVALARKALERGIAPGALSVWWGDQAAAARGLLLGVTNVRRGHVEKECALLKDVLGAQVITPARG